MPRLEFEYNGKTYSQEVANRGEAEAFINSITQSPFTVAVAGGSEPISIPKGPDIWEMEAERIASAPAKTEAERELERRRGSTLLENLLRDYKQTAFDVGAVGAKTVGGLADVGLGTLGAVAYPIETLVLGTPTAETLLGYTTYEQPLYNLASEKMRDLAGAIDTKPDTLVQSMGEFVVPFGPKGSRQKEMVEGALAYGGGEAGAGIEKMLMGADAPETGVGRFLGMFGGPTVGLGATDVARVATPALERQIEAINPNVEKMALEELQRQVPFVFEPEFQKAQTVGAMGEPRTLAEIDPQAAMYERALDTFMADKPFAVAQAEKGQRLQEALKDYGREPRKQTEMTSLLREEAEKMSEAKMLAEGKLRETIAEESTLGTMAQGKQIKAALRAEQTAAKAELDAKWNDIRKGDDGLAKVDVSEGRDAILEYVTGKDVSAQRFASLPKPLQNYIKKLAEVPDTLTVRELDDLRRDGTDLFSSIKDDTNAVSVYNNVHNKLLDSAIAYGKENNIPQAQQLSDAVEASKKYYDTFTTGAVGTAIGKNYTKFEDEAKEASKLVDLFLQDPEKTKELVTKFGTNFPQKILLRQELLKRLSEIKPEQASKYIEEAGNKEIFQQVFGKDLEKVKTYAARRGVKTGYEKYAKLSETSIPVEIFKNDKSTQEFLDYFGGTPAIDMAKGKYIELLQTPTKKKGSYEDLKKLYESQGRLLFGSDYDDMIGILDEIDLTVNIMKRETQIARGKTITTPANRYAEQVKQNRAALRLAEKGTTMGAILGAIAPRSGGPLRRAFSGYVTGKIGNIIQTAAKEKEEALNAFLVELLKDPERIKLLNAPATTENVKKVESMLKQFFKQPVTIAKSGVMATRDRGE